MLRATWLLLLFWVRWEVFLGEGVAGVSGLESELGPANDHALDAWLWIRCVGVWLASKAGEGDRLEPTDLDLVAFFRVFNEM